ncbi:FixJ family two-component response regulator [Angulomicrobium tetraedrale]|uniref:FixJ family two-component response regulator n=1 Tax=Ancylobacter tetraedralis TaxID=217068 RepID=A0A839ZDD0_9HYPH|nr:response regulator transcription factor [Ancylobacter tetraedralis]MBB3772718.1 FixJ family two-component response regulator [Ancylobacter tetraedralis]
MSDRAQVHIVDDDASLRIALGRLLNAAGFDVHGYASTGEFLLNRPDSRHGCLLLDVRLPGPSGLDLHEALAGQGIDLPVIVMSGHADVPSCVRAMKAGAVDFLEKPIASQILLDAVGRALALDLQKRAVRDEENQLGLLFASLSPREREVFERVVAGKLNKQIADELGIAERTVKAQRAHVMEKLGVGSAAELGRIAERILHGRDETARAGDVFP